MRNEINESLHSDKHVSYGLMHDYVIALIGLSRAISLLPRPPVLQCNMRYQFDVDLQTNCHFVSTLLWLRQLVRETWKMALPHLDFSEITIIKAEKFEINRISKDAKCVLRIPEGYYEESELMRCIAHIMHVASLVKFTLDKFLPIFSEQPFFEDQYYQQAEYADARARDIRPIAFRCYLELLCSMGQILVCLREYTNNPPKMNENIPDKERERVYSLCKSLAECKQRLDKAREEILLNDLTPFQYVDTVAHIAHVMHLLISSGSMIQNGYYAAALRMSALLQQSTLFNPTRDEKCRKFAPEGDAIYKPFPSIYNESCSYNTIIHITASSWNEYMLFSPKEIQDPQLLQFNLKYADL